MEDDITSKSVLMRHQEYTGDKLILDHSMYKVIQSLA